MKRQKYTFCYLIGTFNSEQQRSLKQQLHDACIDKVSWQPGYQRLLNLPEQMRPSIVLCTPMLSDDTPAVDMLAALKKQFNIAPRVVLVAFNEQQAELLIDSAYQHGFDALLQWPGKDVSNVLKQVMSGIAMPQYLYIPTASHQSFLFN